ncbi:Homeobox protein Meis3, partial [Eumeta japonica]
AMPAMLDIGSGGHRERMMMRMAKEPKKRHFPKVATNILRAWLFQHLTISIQEIEKHLVHHVKCNYLMDFSAFGNNFALNFSFNDESFLFWRKLDGMNTNSM